MQWGAFYSLSRLGHLLGGWGVLLFWRDAVGAFYSLSQLGHSLGESYTSAEMHSVNSTASVDWATRWGSLTRRQRCSRCILQPQPTGTLTGGVLLICKGAVGVIYSLSRLGHSLGKSYSLAEMQLVYSTALVDWATRWGSLTHLKRGSCYNRQAWSTCNKPIQTMQGLHLWEKILLF